MNKLHQQLMKAPTLHSGTLECTECFFCHRPATNAHHIVPRSQGGKSGPVVAVCGMGNASGCHGLLHAHRLHLWYEDGWKWLKTNRPMKLEEALNEEGWIDENTRKNYRN